MELERTKALAAFCPREVVQHFVENGSKQLTEPLVMDPHECVVLWIDICKFTKLAENMAPEQLGKSISNYFSTLVKIVTSKGGDVLKFCGDALLCSFRDSTHEFEDPEKGLDTAATVACACALEIQNRSFFIGKDKVDLKISIAFGTIHAMLVGGTRDRWEYLVVGEPLQQIRAADKVCEAGQVVVSEQVLARLCNQGLQVDYRETPSRDTSSSISSCCSWRSTASAHTALLRKHTRAKSSLASPRSGKEFLFEVDIESISSSPTSLSTISQSVLDSEFGEDSRIGSPTCKASSTHSNGLVALPPQGNTIRREGSFSARDRVSVVPTMRRARSFHEQRKKMRAKTDSNLPKWNRINASSLSRKPSDLSVSTLSACPVRVYWLRSIVDLPEELEDVFVSKDDNLEYFSSTLRHPLEAFVPDQIRNRLSLLDSFSSHAGFKSSTLWDDSTFAEMRHVTVLFIKIHSITEYSFAGQDPEIHNDDCESLLDDYDDDLSSEISSTFESRNSPKSAWQTATSFASSSSSSVFTKEQGQQLADAIHESLTVIETNLYRYGGTLRQMICDDKGTVAIGVFGVPGGSEAHETNLRADDVSFAVLCALEICNSLRSHEYGFEASVGVATGPAYCGIVGSEIRAEYAIVGDTVNTAARIMGRADAKNPLRAVACDQATRKECQASSMICFDDHFDQVSLKNKAASVRLYYPFLSQRSSLSAGEHVLVGQGLVKSIVQDIVGKPIQSHANQVVLFQGGRGFGKTAVWNHVVAVAKRLESDPSNSKTACYTMECNSQTSPVALLYRDILGIPKDPHIRDEAWIDNLVFYLRKRARELLPFLDLLGGLYPDYREALVRARKACGSEAPRFANQKEANTARACFLVGVFQAMHPFQPVTLAIDDVDKLDAEWWSWLVILVATCSMRDSNRSKPISETCENRPTKPGTKKETLSINTKLDSPFPVSLQQPVFRYFHCVSPAQPRRGSSNSVPEVSSFAGFDHTKPLVPLVPESSDPEDQYDYDDEDPVVVLPVTPDLDRENQASICNITSNQFGDEITSKTKPAVKNHKSDNITNKKEPVPLRRLPFTRSSSSTHVNLHGVLGKPNSCRAFNAPGSSLNQPRFPLQFTAWFVSEDNSVRSHAETYARLFGLFGNGPMTLLSVVMTASTDNSSFEDNCLALIKRNHSVGRVSMRMVPLKPFNRILTSKLLLYFVQRLLPTLQSISTDSLLPAAIMDGFFAYTKGVPKVLELLVSKCLKEGTICFPSGKLWCNTKQLPNHVASLRRDHPYLFNN